MSTGSTFVDGKRGSLRLMASGYYSADGNTTISYKENIYHPFKSRKRKNKYSEITGAFMEEHPMGEHPMWEHPTAFPKKLLLLLVFIVAGGALLAMSIMPWSTQKMPVTAAPQRAASSETPTPINRMLPATILKSHSSPTYHRYGCPERIIWPSVSHEPLNLDAPLEATRCWPFRGDRGHMQLELAQMSHVSHVMLGHITPSQSPTGRITSAPKNFLIFGKKTEDGEEQLLGLFTYDQTGGSFQKFSLRNQNETFKYVRIQVESNWGNGEYTCLYSIQVHGRPAAST